MEMESKKPKPIVEEREERMVSVTGGKPTLRIARFLNPSLRSIDEAMEVPHAPSLLSRTASTKPGETWQMKVQFKGWRVPMRKWKQWVDKLVQIHEPIWRKTCIYDAIMASTYNVKKHENFVFGLAELWCPETNTFVFPWGEATVTLEDMLILGGFSVLGEPVTSPLDENLLKIKDRLEEERKRRPALCSWINHFMESDDDRDVEHIMFLVLWLSRYVFPRPNQDLVGKHVFSIAVHLAQGTRIALAPAVLSWLYRDLSILHTNVISNYSCDVWCDVWGMFHILQLWVWEHFPPLRPDVIHILREGEPRVARWHELKTHFKLQIVRSVLKSSENFQWRCYATNVINWRHPSFYNEQETWVLNDSNIDDELRSFAQCLTSSELVGIDCIEQYLPHRVAMQFGLDQDLPGCFTRANSRWDDAWKTYNKSIKKAAFYVPPRLFESDVTTGYLEWWNQSMKTRSEETSHNLLHQIQGMVCKGLENEEKEESHGSGPPGPRNKMHKLQENVNLEKWSDDIDELPNSQRYLEWLKPSMRNRSEETTDLLSHQRRGMACKGLENEGRDESHGSGPTGFTSKNKKHKLQEDINLESCSDDIDKLPISQSLKLLSNSDKVVNLPFTWEKRSSRSPRSRSRSSLPKMILGVTEIKGKSSIAEKNVSTVSGDEPSSTTQSRTLLQPSMVLSITATKRSPIVVTEKNASTRGDRIGGSTQNDLCVGRETVSYVTDQSGELEDRVLKLEKYFAGLKAMKAKVELKKTTKS